ncbi:hypothetical protein [Tissierella sp.]|uniref:hypothetical protein n=1 Tax=Tissierella sp. TaxID=41274 RepID=UPI003041C25B
MPKFNKLLSKSHNGFEVSLYEFDLRDQENFENLRQYLLSKIKSMKVHNIDDYSINYYASPNLGNDFINKLNQKIAEINTPSIHQIGHFDVRRERVTEWIAQLLLEKNFECVFFDETDKRINITPVNVDKHTPGVDVPGIRLVGDEMKFVICEVKASDSDKIPCGSSESLYKDIEKGYFNEERRITKEILNFMQGVKTIDIKDDILNRIISFLTKLLKESSSQDILIDSIVFFPCIIRNNSKISSELNIDDFKDFNIDGLKGINLESIILAFET